MVGVRADTELLALCLLANLIRSLSDHEVISTTEHDFQIIFQIVTFRSLVASVAWICVDLVTDAR